MGYREWVEVPHFDGWMDTFSFLMARREKSMGVPTGKLEILVLESGGSSWPNTLISVKSPGHELRMGLRNQRQL